MGLQNLTNKIVYVDSALWIIILALIKQYLIVLVVSVKDVLLINFSVLIRERNLINLLVAVLGIKYPSLLLLLFRLVQLHLPPHLHHLLKHLLNKAIMIERTIKEYKYLIIIYIINYPKNIFIIIISYINF